MHRPVKRSSSTGLTKSRITIHDTHAPIERRAFIRAQRASCYPPGMRQHALMIAAFLTLISVTATAAQTFPLQLTELDRSTLERMACQAPHGVPAENIDGHAYGRGANADAIVEVHCASHGMFAGKPVHYVLQCSRDQGKWGCENEWSEILVTAGSEAIPVRVEGKTPLPEANRTIQAIVNGGEFQGQPLRKALEPPCYVNQRKSEEFLDVKCQSWHIIVSTWCPQTMCPRVLSMTKIPD